MASRDAELKIIITAIDRFSKNLDAISAKLNTANRSAKQTATGITALNNRMIAFTRNAQRMVGGLVAIAVATQGLRRGFAATVGLAIDFEDSFAGIRKTMDLTEREFNRLARANRELAKTIPVSVNEINRLGEIAGQLGVRGVDNVIEFEETIAKLAVTTNLTADEAATAMARIASVTKTPISQIDNLASVVVALGNNFATTEAEIVTFATRLAGSASALGFTADQILAIGAAFTAVGVPAERGGTAVQKVLIAIKSAATGASDEIDDFTTILGITNDEFRDLAANDPGDLFIRFVEALAGAGDQAIQVLDSLGLADQRLLASFLSAAGGGDVLRRAIELAGFEIKENTALTEEAEKKFGTTSNQLKLAANNWNDLGISIGQGALPVLKEAAGASIVLTDALDAMVSSVDVTNARLIALAVFTGKVEFVTLGLSVAWAKVFKALPSAVQDAAIAIAGSVDQMVNVILGGLDKIIEGINKFTSLLNEIPGVDIGQIGDIGFRSNIAGGLRAAIAPPVVSRQELARLGERQLAELLAARDILPDFTFGEVPAAAAAAAGKASKAATKALTLADALADGIIELSEAIELGLSIKTAALLELTNSEVEQAAAAFRANVEFEKLGRTLGPLGLLGQIDVFAFAMTDLGQEFRRAGESIGQFVRRLAEAAKDALRTEFSNLFSRPTREQAETELQLAELRRRRSRLFVGGRTKEELEPLLKPLDAEIAALDSLLSLRQQEQRILGLQLDLADQTLLTDRSQLTATRGLTVAMEDFTAALVAQDILPQQEGSRLAGLLGPGGVNISINVQADTREEILRAVNRQTDRALRDAQFAGALQSTGAFLP